MGAFFGGSPNMDHLNPDAPKRSTWHYVKEGFKDSHERGRRMSRSFALAGTVFATFECLIEKKRGKADIWNPVLGGCAAGAALGVRGGPAAMAFGCAGFAAFSGIIEVVMDHD
jgi:mitochondrial import inner membrane translocase subunit TIM22